ncbi:MAG: hypothetical protein DMG49_15225 [Acidobacteria bacterium]|nr:MAG: hypothetical protein DMG49_15225 [Acidobacteriota bacterium]
MGDRRFLGVRGFFAHLERKKYKLHVRVFLSRYRGYSVCGECRGTRLRTEARQVRIGVNGVANGKENTRFFNAELANLRDGSSRHANGAGLGAQTCPATF